MNYLYGGVKIRYGNGDCPVLGGEPAAINCDGCEQAEECAGEGRVPLCMACALRDCNLKPTSACSLFKR